MELKAYLEAILRKGWLVGLIAILSFWLGGIIANSQTPSYTASTSVLINDQILMDSAFPSGVVQLNPPVTYEGQVMAPVTLYRIMKTYPRLTLQQLEKNIVVSTDQTNQVVLINVSDISPFAAADIANFLAQNFVKTQTLTMSTQLNYYNQWLQNNITQLNTDVNNLNTQLPAYTRQQGANLTAQQKEMLIQIDRNKHTLYNDQQSLREVQNAISFLPQIYEILKPASIPSIPTTTPLPSLAISLGAVALGLLVTISLIIAIDYLTPVIRHRGELLKVARNSVITELPQLRTFEQQRLLKSRTIPFMGRIKPLRLLCATISAIAVKHKGHTVLLTSPSKKRRLGAMIATFLSNKGLKTLLIDADFEHPSLHQQIQQVGPCNIQTAKGQALSLIDRTDQPQLFLLSAHMPLIQNQNLTSTTLMDLLPELQNVFDLIIIDAPPLDRADTHLLATKVAQVLLFVKKRSDSLKIIKATSMTCELLKLQPHYVFLT